MGERVKFKGVVERIWAEQCLGKLGSLAKSYLLVLSSRPQPS